MGCTVATVSCYILVDGKDFSHHFIYFSLSSLIFVGIGDSMAALGGRRYGSTKWPGRKNKSQQGSFFCLFFYTSFFIFVLLLTQPQIISGKGLDIFFVGIIVSLVEAYTLQFDNFLCAQLCFAMTVLFNYYFEEYIQKYHLY